MTSTVFRSVARLTLALGLMAGVGPTALSSTAGLEPAETTPADGLDRIYLAQAEAGPSGTTVSFSPEQAERGKESYNDYCVECHGDNLSGGLLGGPPLRGLSFEQKFLNGAPASGLFLFMSNLMPPNSPGRFSPSVYADLMAYILKRNGFQPGAELPSDIDALNNLILEK